MPQANFDNCWTGFSWMVHSSGCNLLCLLEKTERSYPGVGSREGAQSSTVSENKFKLVILPKKSISQIFFHFQPFSTISRSRSRSRSGQRRAQILELGEIHRHGAITHENLVGAGKRRSGQTEDLAPKRKKEEASVAQKTCDLCLHRKKNPVKPDSTKMCTIANQPRPFIVFVTTELNIEGQAIPKRGQGYLNEHSTVCHACFHYLNRRFDTNLRTRDNDEQSSGTTKPTTSSGEKKRETEGEFDSSVPAVGEVNPNQEKDTICNICLFKTKQKGKRRISGMIECSREDQELLTQAGIKFNPDEKLLVHPCCKKSVVNKMKNASRSVSRSLVETSDEKHIRSDVFDQFCKQLRDMIGGRL